MNSCLRPWMGILLGLAGCLTKGPAVVNEQLKTQDPRRQVLDVANYSDAQWENFGFYDGGTTYEHQYGGMGSGFYEYRFRGLDQNPESLVIRARLSAESNTTGLPEEKSEVTLSINGVEVGTQLVVPDDAKGQVYEWKLMDPKKIADLELKPGEQNVLRFEVKQQAALRHGLCLYGSALGSTQDAVPITIELAGASQR